MAANSFGPSKIKVPSEADYKKGMDGKKSYKDLLQQGISRAQDGRGAVYSENDHRSLGVRGKTGSSATPSDEGEKVSPNIPVPSSGKSGLIPEAKPALGVRIAGQIGKSGPR